MYKIIADVILYNLIQNNSNNFNTLVCLKLALVYTIPRTKSTKIFYAEWTENKKQINLNRHHMCITRKLQTQRAKVRQARIQELTHKREIQCYQKIKAPKNIVIFCFSSLKKLCLILGLVYILFSFGLFYFVVDPLNICFCVSFAFTLCWD